MRIALMFATVAAMTVTRWQTSGLSVANYYMTTCFEPVWGLFTSRSERRPPWWALKFLGSLLWLLEFSTLRKTAEKMI